MDTIHPVVRLLPSAGYDTIPVAFPSLPFPWAMADMDAKQPSDAGPTNLPLSITGRLHRPTDDYHHSKSSSGHASQPTESVYRKASEVLNGIIADVYMGIEMPHIYLSRAL